MFHLERAEPPCEPGVRKGMRGGDGQEDSSSSRWVANAASIVSNALVKAGRSLAKWRQPGTAFFADEEGRTEALLKALHLIGHRRLRHA